MLTHTYKDEKDGDINDSTDLESDWEVLSVQTETTWTEVNLE